MANYQQREGDWQSENLFLRSGASGCSLVHDVGCALASVSDLLTTYNLRLPNGEAPDPRSLNEYLAAFQRTCDMDWVNVGNRIAGLGAATVRGTGYDWATVRQPLLDGALNSGNLAIVGMPNPLSQSGLHFVVVFQKSGANDYLIADPWTRANGGRRLTEAYPGVSVTSLEVITFNSGSHPGRTFSIRSHSPVEFVVTDSAGGRTGLDPATGTFYSQISGTMYVDEAGLADSEGGPGLEPTAYFGANDPSPGNYRLHVQGTGVGPYTLDLTLMTSTGQLSTASVSGNATVGSVDDFSITIGDTVSVVPLKSRSVALNGTTGYAESNTSPDLNLTGDWTVEAWFKDEDPNGFNHDFRQIIMKGDRNATQEAPYYVLVGKKGILAGVRTGGKDYPIVADMVFQGLDPQAWHHVAVTFRADLNVLNLWLDGRHIGYLQVPAHSSVGNTLPLEIGRNGQTTGKYWLGKLDDVRIWNVARKGTDITANYKTQLNGPQPGLVANWHFDEVSGMSAADTSGNHHDATLNGGATFSTDIHP